MKKLLIVVAALLGTCGLTATYAWAGDNVVPEPATLTLLAIGTGGLIAKKLFKKGSK